jgi:putative transcriptional regulator
VVAVDFGVRFGSMEDTFGGSVAAPTHHPEGELLVDYVAGTLSPAESLLIALHLEYCADCRQAERAALSAGGALLELIEPMMLPTSTFQRTLQAIEAAPVSTDKVSGSVPGFAVNWPAPLRKRLAAAKRPSWRKLPAGFRALRVPFKDQSSRVWVLDAPGGRGPLRHTHVADEWTMVLEGGFRDETGTYAAGDFALMGPGDQHTMVAEPDEGCLCVLLIREQPRYMTLSGKLLGPLFRL